MTALQFPAEYYAQLARTYPTKRDQLLRILERAGFTCYVPQGAYYLMCDISAFGFSDDVAFARHLVEHVGVAAVPGSSFFAHPADGAHLIRFCFAKRPETLQAAAERFERLLR